MKGKMGLDPRFENYNYARTLHMVGNWKHIYVFEHFLWMIFVWLFQLLWKSDRVFRFVILWLHFSSFEGHYFLLHALKKLISLQNSLIKRPHANTKNIYKSPCIQLLSHDTILIRVTFRSKKGYLALNYVEFYVRCEWA